MKTPDVRHNWLLGRFRSLGSGMDDVLSEECVETYQQKKPNLFLVHQLEPLVMQFRFGKEVRVRLSILLYLWN